MVLLKIYCIFVLIINKNNSMKNKLGVLKKIERMNNLITNIKYYFNTKNYQQAEAGVETLKNLLKDLEETVDVEDDYFLNRY